MIRLKNLNPSGFLWIITFLWVSTKATLSVPALFLRSVALFGESGKSSSSPGGGVGSKVPTASRLVPVTSN